MKDSIFLSEFGISIGNFYFVEDTLFFDIEGASDEWIAENEEKIKDYVYNAICCAIGNMGIKDEE